MISTSALVSTRYLWRLLPCFLVAFTTLYISIDSMAMQDDATSSSRTFTTTIAEKAKHSYNFVFGSPEREKGTCPSPSSPIFPVDRPLDHSLQRCQPVLDLNTTFSVEICSVPSACNQFTVRIRRDDAQACKAMEEGDMPTGNPAVREWMMSRGPDSFLLRTNGAQRWASVHHIYEGDCTYAFDVSLSNGGPVWLEVWFGYESYSYLQENNPAWPIEHHQSLFTAPLKLDFCSDRCPIVFPPRLVEPEPTWPLSTPPVNLPPCPLDQPVQGLWFMRNPMDTADPPYAPLAPRQGDRPLMGHYDFRATCQYSHAGQAFRNHSDCINKPQKILWLGDSHSRYNMLNLVYRLDGNVSPYPESDKGRGIYGQIDPAKTFVYGELTQDFQWSENHGNVVGFDLERLATYDAIIFSNGAWAGMYGMSTDYYQKSIEASLAHIDQVKKPGQRRVFLTLAPFPPQTTGHVLVRREHRTNVLLEKWRDEGVKIAEKYNWRIVDQFERGMPVVMEMLAADALHLSPGPAAEVIVDEILHKAEMCRSSHEFVSMD